MPKLTLSDADYDIIAHCLGIAAEVFIDDANTAHRAALAATTDDTRIGSEQLANEFNRMANEARNLRARIDSRE